MTATEATGDAQARPLALSGATFGADQALARGLVD